MTNEELKNKVAELEKKLKAAAQERDDAVAAAVDAVHAEYADTPGPVKIPGTVKVDLEDTDTGKTKKVEIGIADGYPTVRVNKERDGIASTRTLMKVATGKPLTDAEKAADPVVSGWKADDAKALLQGLAAKGSAMIRIVGVLLLLLVFAFQADAQQMREGRFDNFELDTLTNAETVNWEIGRQMTDYETYDYTWHVTATNLTGTTAVSFIVQETLNPDGGDWVNKDTVAITDDYNNFISGTVTGTRQRLALVSTGTHTTSVKAWVRYRRKKF